MADSFLTVSQVVELLQDGLSAYCPIIPFQGEISEFNLHRGTGHCYLALKDQTAQLNAIIWRSTADNLPFSPKIGDFVQGVARPNVYLKTGKLSLVVSQMQLMGQGILKKRFEELKEKLTKEGLFEQGRKRDLPFLPRAIAILTSQEGAVIHDIMVRISQRMPQLLVYLLPVPVQGADAAEKISQGIKYLNTRSDLDIDLLIVARGGGSLEDLWAFNEEVLIRAIFASRLPVVSAVGHESDLTLSDLVADLRAPTPTAAAEMIVPSRDELLEKISYLTQRLRNMEKLLAPYWHQLQEASSRFEYVVSHKLADKKLLLATLANKLADKQPSAVLQKMLNTIYRGRSALGVALGKVLNAKRESLDSARGRLEQLSPVSLIEKKAMTITNLVGKLCVRANFLLKERSTQVVNLRQRLTASSPKLVLERGFALLQTEDGQIIKHSNALKRGDKLKVTLASGGAGVTVDQTY